MKILMKNPCKNCEEVGEEEDKNHPACKVCTKRMAYLKVLDGETGHIDGDAGKDLKERIDELDFLADQRFRKKMGKEVDMSRDQEIEIVIKDICEDCFTDVSRIRAGGRTPEDSKARREIVERLLSDGFKVPQAKIAGLIGVSYPAVNLIAKKLREGPGEVRANARLIFKVDFTDNRNLYDFLIKESGYQFRTPEDQVLFMLRREKDLK